MKVHHIDPKSFSSLRLVSGFPKDAPTWQKFVFLLALMPMTLQRHKLGERIVSVPRILAMDALALIYLIIAGAIVSNGDSVVFGELFVGGACMMVIFTGIALLHRVVRWVKRLRGERLETRCMGLSWPVLGKSSGNRERYGDAGVAVALGVIYALMSHEPYRQLTGGWFIISGIALLLTESYVVSLDLDRQDALLNAEAHEHIASAHFDSKGRNAPTPATPSAPLPTGLDSTLAANSKQHAHRERSAAAAGPGLSTSGPRRSQ